MNNEMSSNESGDITQQEVWIAADSFWANKEVPSAEKIRKALGHRGSNTTIQKYLNSWRKEVWTQPTPPDPILRAVNELRATLNEEVEEKIKLARQENEEEIKKAHDSQLLAEQERDNAIKQFQALETEYSCLADAQKSLNNKFNEEEKLRFIAEQLNRSLSDQLNETKKQAQQQLNEQSRVHERNITLLKEQLHKAEENANQYKIDLEKLTETTQKQQNEYLEKISILQDANKSFETQILILESNANKYQEMQRQMDSKQVELLSDIKQYQLENKQLIEQLYAQEKHIAVVQSELAQSKEQNNDYKQQLKELHSQLIKCKEKTARFEEKLSKFSEEQKPNDSAKTAL